MSRLGAKCPALAAMFLMALIVIGGCTAGGSALRTAPQTDPWEPLNRPIYAVNDTLDRYTLKPIARGYKTVVPAFMRTGVSNFTNNLSAPASALNTLLQGRPVGALSELARFIVNTSIGIGGLVDIATAGGLERHDEDFGQTLAVWGVPDGPFVMIPFLGPSSMRDALALPVDWVANAQFWIEDSSLRDKVNGVRLLDRRYRLLAAERLLEGSADPYVTLRESYLQNRRFKIHDGDPPTDEDPYEDFEDFEDDEEPAPGAPAR